MSTPTHLTFETLPTSTRPRSSTTSTSSTSSSSTTRSPSPYPQPTQKLHFPNPAVSVISGIGRHAKRTCKQLVSVRGHRSGVQEKAPDMAKTRVVTPVYDHGLGRWVLPDAIDEDEDEDEDEEDWRRGRSGSQGMSFTSSRTSTSSRG